jgi:hypothetical protein
MKRWFDRWTDIIVYVKLFYMVLKLKSNLKFVSGLLKKSVQRYCTYFVVYDSPWLRYIGNKTDYFSAHHCWLLISKTMKTIQLVLVNAVSRKLTFCI